MYAPAGRCCCSGRSSSPGPPSWATWPVWWRGSCGWAASCQRSPSHAQPLCGWRHPHVHGLCPLHAASFPGPAPSCPTQCLICILWEPPVTRGVPAAGGLRVGGRLGALQLGVVLVRGLHRPCRGDGDPRAVRLPTCSLPHRLREGLPWTRVCARHLATPLCRGPVALAVAAQVA